LQSIRRQNGLREIILPWRLIFRLINHPDMKLSAWKDAINEIGMLDAEC
jgi:hypothetical protein